MKKYILSAFVSGNLLSASDFGNTDSPFQTMSQQIFDSLMFNLIIGIIIFLATYNSLKLVFQHVNEQREIRKISQAPSPSFVKNKEKYIKKEELSILNSLKEELSFILNNNIKSDLAKERINDLLKEFEKRFKENINILNNLKINTEEKEIAQKENETILFNLKELISTTKIKKEEFNIEENTEQIKQYLTVLNTKR